MTKERKYDCIKRYVFELTGDDDYARRVADNIEAEGFNNYNEMWVEEGRKLIEKDFLETTKGWMEELEEM